MREKMIGVTVVTPAYKHLEKEAVRRFRKFTGLPVQVIRCKDDQGFFAKLELDRECPRTRIVFFDVDYWLLRPMSPQQWCPMSWVAVQDSAVYNPHAFPHTDCESHRLDKRRYFNSGMFTCNLVVPQHRQVFQEARRMRRRVVSGKDPAPVDVTDQYYLNAAVQKLNPSVGLMPTKFNFYKKAADWGQLAYIPREIIGLHAAGEPLPTKLEALRQQSAVFGSNTCSMWVEAALANQNHLFELR
jgi:hypothetical protein